MSSRALPLAAVLALLPFTAHARDTPANRHGAVPTVHAVRTKTPVVVDGRLDDDAWQAAEPAGGFVERDPDEGRPATERTEVRVAYDDAAVYVAARLFDSEPARIVHRLSRRDDVADADRFTLYLDPRHDHLTGVILEVSAAGVQRDAVLYNDSWDDSSWDGVWASAVSFDDQGWTVEMKIPLSQLRFPAAERATWGINAARYIQRKNETDWLEMVPKAESGLASRMAHLADVDGLRPRRTVSALPYGLWKAELVPPASGDPFHDGGRYPAGGGLDAKCGLTTNLTLDATLNPDFGQVEADPAVVNLSQFETFFDEKRPFFIEGAQIFGNFGRNGANSFWGFNRSEPDLFYSRRIGRAPEGSPEGDFVDEAASTTILGAAKVTGKTVGGWSLGILDAVTAREWARTATSGRIAREQVEPLTDYFVGRAHRDFGRAGIGALGTAVLRERGSATLAGELVQRAYVGGLDGYLFLDARKEWVLSGRIAGSRLEGDASAIEATQVSSQHDFQRPDRKTPRLDPGRTSLSGWTGSINLNRNSGNLQANSALWATSPGFESNDLGFNSRSDRWGGHVVGTWKKTSPDRLTRTRSMSVATWAVFNFDGDRQNGGTHVFLNAQLRNYWSLGGVLFAGWRGWADDLTRGGPTARRASSRMGDVWVETDTRKRASAYLETSYQTNEYGGWSLTQSLQLKVQPASWLSLSLGPNLVRGHTVAQWVGAFADPLATATYGSRYVFAGLDQTEVSMTTRINWILSPRLSLQVYAQPLLSAGAYRGFKELARPRTFDFVRYGTDGGTLLYDPGARRYSVDPDGAGSAAPFAFDDPDFNFKSLRVNAVFRWEWKLGSTIYAVWSQGRADLADPGRLALGRDASSLFHAPADDVFLVKVSCRLGR